MLDLIQQEIENEAKKRLSKHLGAIHSTYKDRVKFNKRTGKKAAGKKPTEPSQWSHHKQFDPRYCINHSKFLAKGIWASLRDGSYAPITAYRLEIPKPSGGIRCIDVFSIPDAAVAKILMKKLRDRNASVFSDASYAYHRKKSPLDAIVKIRVALNRPTVFVSQYDFSKYFDSIDHSYLIELLGLHGPFLTTHLERNALTSVMTHSYTDNQSITQIRGRGVPQGNSLSLFLANAAAHPLDFDLSTLNGLFARFADDTIVLNYSYEDALSSAEAFSRFSKNSSVEINASKSTGIRIFSSKNSEMASVKFFDFLGYRFHKDGIRVSDRSIRSIKRRCSKIIFNHLLLHPRRVKAFSRKRLGAGFCDWDLVTCVNELRNYIYGGRSQSAIDQYLDDAADLRRVTGAVSYFCLVDDGRVFRQLDGWLLSALHRAYVARIKLLNNLGNKKYTSISSRRLTIGSWYNFNAIPMETRLPSFFTAWRAARKSWSRHGMGGVDSQGGGYFYE